MAHSAPNKSLWIADSPTWASVRDRPCVVTDSAQRHLDTIADLGRFQDHVVARLQLTELGVGSDTIRNHVAAGRWQALGTRVVVLHGGPLTATQQLWRAVLAQPRGAALAGITAAVAHGLEWKSPEQTHVILPAGARPQPLEDVVVHVSRRFDPLTDVAPVVVPPAGRAPGRTVAQPPATGLARSVVDAAAWATNDRRACGVLCAGVQQRLTTAPELRTALDSAGMVQRHRLIGQTLDDILGGAQSFAEIDFVLLARLAGLPPPLRQAKRRDAEGRWRYLDVDFGFFSVEVDGALHLLPRRYWDDMHRQNNLALRGVRLLRFPTVAIRIDRPAVVSQLREAKRVWG